MKLRCLNISPRRSFNDPGPDNPLVAKIEIRHDENTLRINLSEGVAEKLLELAQEEIIAATVCETDRMREEMQQVIAMSKPAHLEDQK